MSAMQEMAEAIEELGTQKKHSTKKPSQLIPTAQSIVKKIDAAL